MSKNQNQTETAAAETTATDQPEKKGWLGRQVERANEFVRENPATTAAGGVVVYGVAKAAPHVYNKATSYFAGRAAAKASEKATESTANAVAGAVSSIGKRLW